MGAVVHRRSSIGALLQKQPHPAASVKLSRTAIPIPIPISIIFSFLTYPKKNRPDETLVSGTAITPDDRKRNNMRGDLSDAAGSESNIPVMFTSDNAQANPVRTELLALG